MITNSLPVADLGEGLGASFPPSPLFWVKQIIAEGRRAGKFKHTIPPPPLSAQGMDLPLITSHILKIKRTN